MSECYPIQFYAHFSKVISTSHMILIYYFGWYMGDLIITTLIREFFVHEVIKAISSTLLPIYGKC